MTHDNNDQIRRRGNHLLSGRKFDAHELELMLLGFLADSPAHGYELIKRFDTLSKGYYSPSPGVLYPALARLEARGYLQAQRHGRRKNYHLTAAGQTYSTANASRTRQLLAIMKHAAKKMAWMHHASDDPLAAADATGWLPEFVQTRIALQAALLKQSDADHDEQRRVVSILQRAIADILKTTPDTAPNTTESSPLTGARHDD